MPWLLVTAQLWREREKVRSSRERERERRRGGGGGGGGGAMRAPVFLLGQSSQHHTVSSLGPVWHGD